MHRCALALTVVATLVDLCCVITKIAVGIYVGALAAHTLQMLLQYMLTTVLPTVLSSSTLLGTAADAFDIVMTSGGADSPGHHWC